MFIIEQLPWGALNTAETHRLCEDKFLRDIEGRLRGILFRWDHFRDDRVIFPWITIPKSYYITQTYGMDPIENTLPAMNGAGAQAHVVRVDQLQNEEDISKIRFQISNSDEEKSKAKFERTKELLNGILGVRWSGYTGYGHVWDEVIRWHGIEQSIIDLVDRPEFIHKILERAFAVYDDAITQYEQAGAIDVGGGWIHCNGAYTDELPGYNYETEEELSPLRYSAKNTWACSAAQIFSTVSPAMHEEFDIDYQIKWFSRFGMGYYGCCEPLDQKIDIIRKLPNIRKISMSPWVNMERGAEAMNGDYVFSRKPSPAFLASSAAWDAAAVRKDLEDAVRINQKYGNPVELILKDVTTIGHNPARVEEWAAIARDVIGIA
jgi:hypothetical protein